ncbi:MAG: phosphatidate cytidylyltransferase [Alphaproteobacteria bacterium]|nr:phosphatidate cytidylyltransferase [Alphaproteobacteria bacterium]
MNFPDLRVRLITGMILWAVLGLWICYSMKIPMVFPIGLSIMASICLYEWFRMGAGKSIPLRMAGATIIGFGFWTCHCMVDIHSRHYYTQIAIFICVLLLGPITDTAAYFGGRLMGGPKLCPAISPSKTWAGFLSAVALVPMLAFLYLYRFTWFSLPDMVSYTLFVAFLCLAAQTGDLLESWAKRKFGVKDSGSWLPGHGGLLDRLDSILAIAIAVFLLQGCIG